MNKPLYYTAPGGVSVPGLVATLLAGLVAAVVLGLGYALADYHISLVYIMALLCGLMGLCIGKTIAHASRNRRLHSVPALMLIGLICGLVAEYVQWAFFVSLAFNDGNLPASFSTFVKAALNPGGLFETIMALMQEGLWTLKGKEVKGNMLGAIWAAEGLVLIGATIFYSRDADRPPYSETVNAWMKGAVAPVKLAFVQDPKAFSTQVEGQGMAALATLPPQDAECAEFSRLTLFSCEGETDAYLSLDNVTTKIKKKKVEEDVDNVFKFLRVNAADASRYAAELAARASAA